MKKGVEERRSEASCRPDPGLSSPLEEVPMGHTVQEGPQPTVFALLEPWAFHPSWVWG